MTDASEPELSAFLARARAGLTPSTEDAARVRAAVGVTVASEPSPGAPAARAGESARRAVHGGTRSPALRALGRFGLVAAIAAGAGAGGYALGYRAGFAERERVRLSEPTAVVQLPARTAVAPTESAAPAPLPNSVASSAPEPRTQARGARAAASNSGASAPASGASSPAAAGSESSLELEARLLGRVERALRDSNPRFALGLLGELDREVPGGQLGEEREAARVMAHCALGTPYAAKLASDFTSRHAQSAYAARVADACVGAEHGDAGE